MTLPAPGAPADLTLARSGGHGARAHRGRIAFLLWWPALAVVIVLAEIFHWNGPEGLVALALLWGPLLVYVFWRR